MKHKKRQMRKPEAADASPTLLLCQCALGAILSPLLMLPLSLLLSLICSGVEDPLAWLPTFGTGLSFLSYFLCGILSARKIPTLPLVTGSVGGVFLSLLFLLIGQIFSAEALTFTGSILPKLLGIACSILGAYLLRIRQSSQKRIKMRAHGRR